MSTHPRASAPAGRAGILVVLLGIWGALVPFVGPSFGYGMGGTPAWTWTESHATLHLAPGLVAIIGGLLLLRGPDRSAQRLGAVLAAAAGTWFVIAPSLHPLWAVASGMGGMHGMGESALSGALSALGYHYGTGAAIALAGAYAVGILGSRASTPTGDSATSPHGRAAGTPPLVDSHR